MMITKRGRKRGGGKGGGRLMMRKITRPCEPPSW
jgi:hypothetical protein